MSGLRHLWFLRGMPRSLSCNQQASVGNTSHHHVKRGAWNKRGLFLGKFGHFYLEVLTPGHYPALISCPGASKVLRPCGRWKWKGVGLWFDLRQDQSTKHGLFSSSWSTMWSFSFEDPANTVGWGESLATTFVWGHGDTDDDHCDYNYMDDGQANWWRQWWQWWWRRWSFWAGDWANGLSRSLLGASHQRRIQQGHHQQESQSKVMFNE